MWLNCFILSLIESVDGLLSLLLNDVLDISCSFILVDSLSPLDSIRSVGDLVLSCCRALIRSRNDTFNGGFTNADGLKPALVDGIADDFKDAIVEMALNVDDDDDCGCDCDD